MRTAASKEAKAIETGVSADIRGRKRGIQNPESRIQNSSI
jgi:hypothetical protein